MQSTAMHPPLASREAMYRAVASRDRRFEGRFFVGVTTTGIYCRPGCPAPLPKAANVRFFPCAAAAEEAGFRPCMRCRPESVPHSPAWLGTSATVKRALRLIDEGDVRGVEPLASRLGIGARHLRRLFAEHVGASPVTVAQTRRVHFARKLLDETSLPVTEVAHASGFASVRRFNDAMQRTFRASPTALRRGRAAARRAEGDLALRLPFVPPYDWGRLLSFFAARATPGVEGVTHGKYRRTAALDGEQPFVLEVEARLDERCLVLRAPARACRELLTVVERVRGLFDLGADPSLIAAQLRGDPMLRPLVQRRPGLRVPGAWDPFEYSVRAILGQQISVKGATTLAGRLAQAFGRPLAELTDDGLTHVFPTPEALAKADLGSIGLPRARAHAIRGLAKVVASGELSFVELASLEDALARLTALEGIGPWTAQMIAMRALHEPDAFPAGDLGVRKALEAAGHRGSTEERAERWRPWRAYAAIHLWARLQEEESC